MNYHNTIEGLEKMFYANIAIIICSILGIIPGINILAALAIIAAYVFYLIGMNKVSKDISTVSVAFALTIAQTILSLLTNRSSSLGLQAFSTIINLIIVLCICLPLSGELKARNEESVASFGKIVAIICVITYAVSIILCISLIAQMNALDQARDIYREVERLQSAAVTYGIIMIILGIVAGICQLVFYRKSIDAFSRIQCNIPAVESHSFGNYEY